MKLSRRKFLASLSLGFQAIAGSSRFSPARSSSKKKVIIIGAGMAGLAAASHLIQRGLEVCIFEARDRIGGRIWTDSSLGFPIELGASWIHGRHQNPITALAANAKLSLLEWDYDDITVLNKRNFKVEIEKNYETFMSQIEYFANSLSGNAKKRSIEYAIQELRKRGGLSGISDYELQVLATYGIELSHAKDVGNLSLTSLLEGREFSGLDAILLDGYEQIPRVLSNSIDIRYNKRVDIVSYSEHGVEVVENGKSHSADYLIVTIPLGVLKSGNLRFFPTLPETKQSVLNQLEMGLLNKTFLKLESDEGIPDTLNFLRLSKQPQAFPFWINLSSIVGEPVVGVLSAGSFAKTLENQTETDRVTSAYDAMSEMVGRQIAPLVTGRSSNWSNDPFAIGSYSSLKLTASPGIRTSLAAPIAGRVFFAGEATSSNYPATVHGAYFSGINAAKQIY